MMSLCTKSLSSSLSTTVRSILGPSKNLFKITTTTTTTNTNHLSSYSIITPTEELVVRSNGRYVDTQGNIIPLLSLDGSTTKSDDSSFIFMKKQHEELMMLNYYHNNNNITTTLLSTSWLTTTKYVTKMITTYISNLLFQQETIMKNNVTTDTAAAAANNNSTLFDSSSSSWWIWLIKRTFQPSIIRKKRKMGYLKRSKSVGGRRILKRRMKKGRARLFGA